MTGFVMSKSVYIFLIFLWGVYTFCIKHEYEQPHGNPVCRYQKEQKSRLQFLAPDSCHVLHHDEGTRGIHGSHPQKRNTAVATAVAAIAHQFIGAVEPGPMFTFRLWFRFSLVPETILKQTTDTSHTVRQNQHAGTTTWPFSFPPYPCGVSCLRVILQHAGHAKVRDFADQVAVDQDVASGEVAVHVAHVRQVLHPWANATQHPHQLDDCEPAIILLHMGKGAKSRSIKLKATLLPVLKLAKSRAEDSHLLSNKMQCYFLAFLTRVYNSPVKQKPRGSVTAFSDAVFCLQWIWF